MADARTVTSRRLVSHRPATSPVCQKVPDLPAALPSPRFLPDLPPQGLLLLLPRRAPFEVVFPRLCSVWAPPALGGGSLLRPVQVPTREVVPCFHLVEP